MKFRIRWRLMLIGLCLLAFGLALPFALNYYYSSRYSQISQSRQIPANRLKRTNSLKLSFQKKSKTAAAADSFQTGSALPLPEAEAKEFMQPGDFENASYGVSANPADIIPVSAFDSNYPEIAKVLPAKLQNSAQTPLTIALSTSVVRLRCPSGSKPAPDMSCGNTKVIVRVKGGQPPYRYSVSGGRLAGQGKPRAVWDLSDAQPDDYLYITVVSGNEIARKDIRVEKCICSQFRPPLTPTPTPKLTPTPTPLLATPTRTPKTPTPSPTTGTMNANIPVNVTPGNTTANNSNTNNPNSDADKIGFTYPSRFIKGTEYTVCLSLQPENSEVNLCENTESDTPVVIGGAVVPSITKPGFGTFVTAELKTGDGLQVVGKPEETRLSYNRQSGDFPQWKWKLKLSDAGENAKAVEIQFRCDVEWVSKENSAVVEKQEKYWTSEALESRIGLPLTSKIFTFLSTLTGGLAFIFSVAPALGGKKSDILVPPVKGQTNDVASDLEIVVPPISGQTLEDEVHCTLYAPGKARAGESFVIQIFAHLIEQAEGLEEMAKALDEEARKHVAEKLKKKIKRGSTLTFKLMMPGLEAAETEESAEWEGEPLDVQFIVSVPDNHASGNRFGKVSVYENNEKIGTITFRIEILARGQEIAQTSGDTLSALAQMSRKESAFISYASEDKAEVYDFLRLLDSIGVTYHVDIFSIAPGDRWEQKLYEFIDADDVFLLFWSKAARRSEWVIKEAERAHQKTGSERKNPPKIVIFHLETPEAELPEWLRDIHYDRKWSQLSKNARPQN